MVRILDAAIEAELLKHDLNVQVCLHFAFDSGDLRLWTGVGDLPAGGYSWTGGGDLLQITQIEESAEVVSQNMDYSMSGLNSSMIALALGEHYQGRSVEQFLVFFDSDGQVIQSLVPMYKGFLDVMNIKKNKTTTDITIRAENRLRNLRQAPLTLFTDQDQQSKFPGDKGLEFVPMMQEKMLLWGRV